MILAAQRGAEEKKVRFYGNLLANLAFEQDVDRSKSNFLLRLGEQLSYRQLCLLSLFAQNTLVQGGNNRFNLRSSSYRDRLSEEAPIATDLIVLLQETYDLGQRGIIGNGGSAMLDIVDANPSEMSPEGGRSEPLQSHGVVAGRTGRPECPDPALALTRRQTGPMSSSGLE